MQTAAFQNWQRDGYLLYDKAIFKTEGNHCKWGRLLCLWHEKGKGPSHERQHHVCYSIDLYSGEVYLDDSKKVIFMKMLGSVVLRVSQVFQKTLFHILFPVSFPIIIASTAKQELAQNHKMKTEGRLNEVQTSTQIGWKCLTNCGKSIEDIVRTPIYGIAMIVSSLFAVIIAPFEPAQLYDLRKSIAAFEDKLCKNDHLGWWKFTPCFHPFTTIDKIQQQVRPKHEDTEYSACRNQFEINLANIARSTVLYNRRREKRDTFRCFSTHPYQSADFSLIHKERQRQSRD